MTAKKLLISALFASAVLLSGCGDKDKHGLSGNIKDAAEGTFAVLEAVNDYGYWYPVDSAEIDKNGDFFIPYEAPHAPQLYRVRYAGKYVYLPLDSTERLTLKAHAHNFDKSFTLSGSKLADRFTAFEREAQRVEALQNPDSTDAFRKRVYEQYLAGSHGDMLGYYILTRPFDDGYLIEYTDPLFSAVANTFLTYLPDDPHTQALVEAAKQGQAERRRRNGYHNVMEAQQIALIDVDLPDLSGAKHKLSDNVAKGKPTVLFFTSFASDDNAAVTRTLKTLYEAGKADVFEVSLDTDHLVISNGAKGLPWTVVYDPDGLSSELLLKYNIGSLPVMFIYDSKGELVQRAANSDELHKYLSQTR